MTHPVPASPSGTRCALCGEPALVVWQRRLTDTELAAHIGLEKQRREQRKILADPQRHAPDFGALPTPGDCAAPVYACGPHAITLDAASLIHAKTCTAPNAADLPGCNCTPEPTPAEPAPDKKPAHLPAHWAQ